MGWWDGQDAKARGHWREGARRAPVACGLPPVAGVQEGYSDGKKDEHHYKDNCECDNSGRHDYKLNTIGPG